MLQVLIEDALKLQSAVLSASTSLPPALQQLIPNLMAILQRGKDNAAVFQVLEGFLVTADADLTRAILQGHLAQLVPALERSLGSILTAAQKAQSGTRLYLGIKFPLVWWALALLETILHF